MATRIEIDANAAISTMLIGPHGTDPHEDLVELQITDGMVRLAKDEAAILALLLDTIVNDYDRRHGAAPLQKVLVDEGRTITRNELMGALLLLPGNAEIVAQFAGQLIGLIGLERSGDEQGAWYTLDCNPHCVEDVLTAWHIPLDKQKQILSGRI